MGADMIFMDETKDKADVPHVHGYIPKGSSTRISRRRNKVERQRKTEARRRNRNR